MGIKSVNHIQLQEATIAAGKCAVFTDNVVESARELAKRLEEESLEGLEGRHAENVRAAIAAVRMWATTAGDLSKGMANGMKALIAQFYTEIDVPSVNAALQDATNQLNAATRKTKDRVGKKVR